MAFKNTKTGIVQGVLMCKEGEDQPTCVERLRERGWDLPDGGFEIGDDRVVRELSSDEEDEDEESEDTES